MVNAYQMYCRFTTLPQLVPRDHREAPMKLVAPRSDDRRNMATSERRLNWDSGEDRKESGIVGLGFKRDIPDFRGTACVISPLWLKQTSGSVIPLSLLFFRLILSSCFLISWSFLGRSIDRMVDQMSLDQAAVSSAAPPKKIPPPSPPMTIKDKGRGWSYVRVGFLGEVSDTFHLNLAMDELPEE